MSIVSGAVNLGGRLVW